MKKKLFWVLTIMGSLALGIEMSSHAHAETKVLTPNSKIRFSHEILLTYEENEIKVRPLEKDTVRMAFFLNGRILSANEYKALKIEDPKDPSDNQKINLPEGETFCGLAYAYPNTSRYTVIRISGEYTVSSFRNVYYKDTQAFLSKNNTQQLTLDCREVEEGHWRRMSEIPLDILRKALGAHATIEAASPRVIDTNLDAQDVLVPSSSADI